jgi:hypothetical protein
VFIAPRLRVSDVLAAQQQASCLVSTDPAGCEPGQPRVFANPLDIGAQRRYQAVYRILKTIPYGAEDEVLAGKQWRDRGGTHFFDDDRCNALVERCRVLNLPRADLRYDRVRAEKEYDGVGFGNELFQQALPFFCWQDVIGVTEHAKVTFPKYISDVLRVLAVAPGVGQEDLRSIVFKRRLVFVDHGCQCYVCHNGDAQSPAGTNSPAS